MTNQSNPIGTIRGTELKPVFHRLRALRACRDFHHDLEEGHRESRYRLLAMVYAESIRIAESAVTLKLFYEEEYWAHRSRHKPRDLRDIFRDVCAYVTTADNTEARKIASKYAKVLSHLHSGEVPPENAESAIHCCGGIEAIARRGLCKPPTFDPNSFDDDHSQEEKAEEEASADKECWIDDWSKLDDHVRREDSVQGEVVLIKALCRSAPDGPAFTILSVKPIQGVSSNVADKAPSQTDIEFVRGHDRPPLIVEVSPERLQEVLSVGEGRKAKLTIECVSIRDSGWVRLKARKFTPLPEDDL